MLRLNSKQESKSTSSTSVDEEFESSLSSTEDIGYKNDKGTAQDQSNKWSKRSKRNQRPDFVDSFESSNIDALAYDPDKKQMWVRFKGNDVYTYYDVPLTIYRGFWTAASKGRYFHQKIRKNQRIKYQHLGSSLRWHYLRSSLSINSSKQQANVASIAESFRKKAKKQHHDWNWCGITNIQNGRRIDFEEFFVEICSYGDKVHISIINRDTEKTDCSTTKEIDTRTVAEYILNRCEKKLQSLSSGRMIYPNAGVEELVEGSYNDAERLYNYICNAIPEQDWSEMKLEGDAFYIEGDAYDIVLIREYSGWSYTVKNKADGESSSFEATEAQFVSSALTDIMRVVLQGD